LINALPGNSFVNTVQHATIDEAVFSMSASSSSGTTGFCNPFLSIGSVNIFPHIGPCCESGDVINNREAFFYFRLLSINIKISTFKTIILPMVLYRCETWSLTLREECRLRVFENKVPMRIFGPKMDEVKGDWRKLHNEELHNLYSSPSITEMIKSRRIRSAGHIARIRTRGTHMITCWEREKERGH
jgi:hypothetical protein